MDDGLFGFLVFLGMMVASVVYSKRKLAMEEAAEEENTAPTPKSIIKDLTKLHKKATAPKPTTKKSFQPSSDFIGRNNYVKDELKTSEEHEEQPSPYAFESMDDVRKAFIWSEILKRKY
ncbi:MAG: hypothetical protein Q4D30_09900 [Bacteroidales bacterium]|nr:hypothetical protein [Bacteroidales bacterium]